MSSNLKTNRNNNELIASNKSNLESNTNINDKNCIKEDKVSNLKYANTQENEINKNKHINPIASNLRLNLKNKLLKKSKNLINKVKFKLNNHNKAKCLASKDKLIHDINKKLSNIKDNINIDNTQNIDKSDDYSDSYLSNSNNKSVSNNKISTNLSNKTKRRSRHEEDGRIFKCECGKSYLSDTALTNHRIVKHNYQSEKRGKGRPKKYESSIPFSSISFNKYNEVFFSHPLRLKKSINFSKIEIIEKFYKKFNLTIHDKENNNILKVDNNTKKDDDKITSNKTLSNNNLSCLNINKDNKSQHKNVEILKKVNGNIFNTINTTTNSSTPKPPFRPKYIFASRKKSFCDDTNPVIKSTYSINKIFSSNINNKQSTSELFNKSTRKNSICEKSKKYIHIDNKNVFSVWLGSLFEVIFEKLTNYNILFGRAYFNYPIYVHLVKYSKISTEDQNIINIVFKYNYIDNSKINNKCDLKINNNNHLTNKSNNSLIYIDKESKENKNKDLSIEKKSDSNVDNNNSKYKNEANNNTNNVDDSNYNQEYDNLKKDPNSTNFIMTRRRSYSISKLMIQKEVHNKFNNATDSRKDLEICNNNNNIDKENKFISIDECMVEYLCFVSNNSNLEYFHFSILFIVLFREFLNSFSPFCNQKLYISKLNNSEYTADNNITAQDIPKYCDSFISDFLEPKDYYSIYEPDEIVQIIQHFCYWLFENGYTKFRVTLVNLIAN